MTGLLGCGAAGRGMNDGCPHRTGTTSPINFCLTRLPSGQSHREAGTPYRSFIVQLDHSDVALNRCSCCSIAIVRMLSLGQGEEALEDHALPVGAYAQ